MSGSSRRHSVQRFALIDIRACFACLPITVDTFLKRRVVQPALCLQQLLQSAVLAFERQQTIAVCQYHGLCSPNGVRDLIHNLLGRRSCRGFEPINLPPAARQHRATLRARAAVVLEFTPVRTLRFSPE